MKGVLLVNLGSPDSPEPADVKNYLREFLMDERVIDFPYLVRSLLVKGIILNTRPKKSAKAYKKIWWKEGAPLIVLSKRLKEKLEKKVDLPVELAMRYGNPSIKYGLDSLSKKGVNEILLIPLYPQFAMATTETILVLAEEIKNKYYPHLKFSSFKSFYDDKNYIRVLSNSIKEFLNNKKWEHLLFSYHGLPISHVKRSDKSGKHCQKVENCCGLSLDANSMCYAHHCSLTTEAVTKKLELPELDWSMSYQSRLGPAKWLKPSTTETVQNLARNGIKKLVIVSHAFLADGLETLEELDIEIREEFLSEGGEELVVVKCLNDNPSWISGLSNLINEAFSSQSLPMA